MYIIERINSKANGELTLDFKFGTHYATLQEANEECKRYLEWYGRHSKKLNKKVGEYLIIVDSNNNYRNCWYLFNNEIDYVRANSFSEVQWFAYSMANWE